jgi:hypothetical protein
MFAADEYCVDDADADTDADVDGDAVDGNDNCSNHMFYGV